VIRRGKLVYARDPKLVERDARIVLRFLSGESMQAIGADYGISRERVRQRLAALGLDSYMGGARLQTVLTARSRREVVAEQKRLKEEKRAQKLYGVGAETVYAITGIRRIFGQVRRHPDGILSAYLSQKRNAQKRGIGWKLNLESWWGIWLDSGHWTERGRGTGYCMARWADEGPYSPENVYICTNSQNIKDGYITKPASVRMAKRRANAAASI
jgi:hypothetical protein